MSRFLVTLDAVNLANRFQVGGKAAFLGTLTAAGFPVPTGLCLTVAAFHLALQPYQPALVQLGRNADHTEPEQFSNAASEIARILADLVIPQPMGAELFAFLSQMFGPETVFAVRSSATLEDRSDASYAGQYVTVLGARGREEIEAAILSCWRSFFSANALAAQNHHGGRNEQDGMAVLIQPLVAAECAGVAYSVDPVGQRRDRVVINAGWGLGVGVADGSVATDTAWLARDEIRLQRQQIIHKPERIELDANGNLQRGSVPLEQRNAACLPPEWLTRLAQFVIAAQSLLGSPQDMEWAITDGDVWVLQSRPIAALSPDLVRPRPFPVEWENETDRQVLWHRDVNEGQEEVLLPLELDHLAALDDIWMEGARTMGGERYLRLIFCNGRAYGRRFLVDRNEAERRVRRAAVLDLRDRLRLEERTAWDHWGPEIVMATERLRGFDREGADGPALAAHVEEALAVYRRHFMLHAQMIFKPHRSFIDSYAALSGQSGGAAEEAAYRLLDSEETPLTRLIDALYALSCSARSIPAVASLLEEMPSDAIEQLSDLPQAGAFLQELDTFLVDYGERTGHGYGSSVTLRMPTWREQPAAVLSLLRSYMDTDLEAPTAARVRARRAQVAQIEELCTACSDAATIAEFRHHLAYARRAFAVLEIHNHYIDQMSIGQLRHAVMAAAHWLVARGVLNSPDDILWLHFAEITSALRGNGPSQYDELIAGRRTDHAAWCQLEAPPCLGVPDADLSQRPPYSDEVTTHQMVEANILQGQGASRGLVRGRARLATDLRMLPALLPGDILVAWNVGPLWTPILPKLAGLILESGSIGQHAAATAREYGLPAVVNVQRALECIPDGAWVTIDGETGVVTLDHDSTC